MSIDIVPKTPTTQPNNSTYEISATAYNAGTQKLTQTAAGVLGATAAGDTGVLTPTAGQVLLGSATPAPAWTSVSGDAALSSAGALTLATVNSNVGSFGDGTHVAAVTVDAKGRVTAVSAVAITGGGAADGDGLVIATATDADTTMVVGKRYVADMSAWATADRVYTLPTGATVGDRIGITVTAGNASFELLLKTGVGQTCAFKGSTIAASTEITRLFITGESMIFRYEATNVWAVEHDGRVAQVGLMRLTTTTNTTGSINTYYQPTARAGAWTADVNIGSICTVASDRITVRRAGTYLVEVSGRATGSNAAAGFFTVAACKNGNTSTELYMLGEVATSGASSNNLGAARSGYGSLATDDYLVFVFRYNDSGGQGLSSFTSPRQDTVFQVRETL